MVTAFLIVVTLAPEFSWRGRRATVTLVPKLKYPAVESVETAAMLSTACRTAAARAFKGSPAYWLQFVPLTRRGTVRGFSITGMTRFPEVCEEEQPPVL
jgi:hypothetical protein